MRLELLKSLRMDSVGYFLGMLLFGLSSEPLGIARIEEFVFNKVLFF